MENTLCGKHLLWKTPGWENTKKRKHLVRKTTGRGNTWWGTHLARKTPGDENKTKRQTTNEMTDNKQKDGQQKDTSKTACDARGQKSACLVFFNMQNLNFMAAPESETYGL